MKPIYTWLGEPQDDQAIFRKCFDVVGEYEETTHFIASPSVITMTAHIDHRAKHAYDREPYHSDEQNARTQHWTMTDSLEDAKTMGRRGWSEGAKILSRMANPKLSHDTAAALGMDMPSRQHFMEPSAAGHTALVPEFLAGQPLSMGAYPTSGDKTGVGRVARFMIPASWNGHVRAMQILLTTAPLVAVCDALRHRNIESEIYLAFCPGISTNRRAAKSDRRISFLTCIKKQTARLDLPALATTLHPSFLRRLLFRLLELEEQNTEYSRWYYGVTDVDEEKITRMIATTLNAMHVSDSPLSAASGINSIEEITDQNLKELVEQWCHMHSAEIADLFKALDLGV